MAGRENDPPSPPPRSAPAAAEPMVDLTRPRPAGCSRDPTRDPGANPWASTARLVAAHPERRQRRAPGAARHRPGRVAFEVITPENSYLRPSNLVYIFGLSTVYVVLATAEIFVLLLGEIDLSIGSVALLGGTIAFKLVQVAPRARTGPGGRRSWPRWSAAGSSAPSRARWCPASGSRRSSSPSPASCSSRESSSSFWAAPTAPSRSARRTPTRA